MRFDLKKTPLYRFEYVPCCASPSFYLAPCTCTTRTALKTQRRVHGHWTGRFYMLRGAGELHAFAGKDATSLTAPISTLSVGSATVLAGPPVKEAAQADGLFVDEVHSNFTIKLYEIL